MKSTEPHNLSYTLGVLDELRYVYEHNQAVNRQLNWFVEASDKSLVNEHWFAITKVEKYEYWLEVRTIIWQVDKLLQPKEVYKLVNPQNKLCQFEIASGSKFYSFFHNKVGKKTYRHYTIVECKHYDF